MRHSTLFTLLTSPSMVFSYYFVICARDNSALKGKCTHIDGDDNSVLATFPVGYQNNLKYLEVANTTTVCNFSGPALHLALHAGDTLEDDAYYLLSNITTFVCR